MKRGGPLKRHTRLRQRRATPRRSGRVRDRDYLLAVKELPCCLRPDDIRVMSREPTWESIRGARLLSDYVRGMIGPCDGPTEADHAGVRPVGRKADDDTAIPLCRRHHRERTDYTGVFGMFNAALMRNWCDMAIAATRARLGWKEAA